jgi:hypothetical protein
LGLSTDIGSNTENPIRSSLNTDNPFLAWSFRPEAYAPGYVGTFSCSAGLEVEWDSKSELSISRHRTHEGPWSWTAPAGRLWEWENLPHELLWLPQPETSATN